MAIAEGNELVRVVVPRELVDRIRAAQEVAGETPKPAAYIRARLAGWLAVDERLGALEGSVAGRLDGVEATLREVLASLDVLRDDVQAAGLVAPASTRQEG
jgi:hypothetical protein